MIKEKPNNGKLFLILVLMYVNTGGYSQNSVSATYSSGDIPTFYNVYNESCNGPAILSITLPPGEVYEVTGIDIQYSMQASNSAFMSDQRSQLYCQNTSTLEPAIYSGTGNTEGVLDYYRGSVNIANGEYSGGTVLTFEMRAWRSWGSAPICSDLFNMVQNNTWSITVKYGNEIIKPKVGINTESPSQTFDVDGKIKIGDDLIPPTEGTVRYQEGTFEGYDGNRWSPFNSFDQEAQGTLLFSRVGSDENLMRMGYELAGSVDLNNSKVYNGKHTGTFTEISVPVTVPHRSGHTAVWTGTEMLIWGGAQGSTHPSPTFVGFREVIKYNPTTNVWTVMPLGVGAPPETRSGHSAVWTGSRMIIWGGRINQTGPTTLSTGYSYNPDTNTWIPLSQFGSIPSARQGHDAVWDGTEMMIYGGGSAIWGKYNPASGTWTTLPIGPSYMNSVACVYTGTEMIVYGRTASSGNIESAKFNTTTNNWVFPLPSNGPHPRSGNFMDAVWTGTEMIVWGGSIPGGRYDPITNDFNFIGNKGPIITSSGSAVWTGTEMIIFGGSYTTTTGGASSVSNQCYSFTLTGEESSFSAGGTSTIFYYDKTN